MGRKKKRRGKRRVKKKGIKAGAEAEAETQVNPSSPNIPEEVVVEILSRLPLRSLPRFTCVSKQWRSLVPDIIAKGTRKKMVLLRSFLRSGTFMHSMDEESRVEQVTTPFDQTIKSKYYPVLYGSCNGLLLIRIDDDLFLWNPVTRYSKKVLSHESLADDSYIVGSLGLCHDSSTNEYKAIMALYHESPDYRGHEFVNVGSFRCKNWTRVRFPYKVHTVGSGPVVNGHLHWYASDENSGHFLSSHQILYFNPHTNQFSNLPMPEPKNRLDGNMILGLGVLEGCLSMVRHDSPRYSEVNSVEVLAMKEYGMQNSWTKLFSISNLALMYYGKLEPLCYTKDGEALMITSKSSESVRAYDPIDSSYKEILVQSNCDSVHAIMYEESLDTPTDYDWEEEEKKGEPAYVQYYSYSRPCKWTKKRNGWRLASLGD